MAILAGIDEAGFGPTLGPLVVSGVVFRVPDDRLDQCLWNTLQATCAPRVGGRGHRLVIADSKQLYRSRGSLQPLERAALVMLTVAGHRPSSWHGLLDAIAPHAIEQLGPYPWYVDADIPLPVNEDIGDLATQANAIRRDCARHGVAFCSVLSEPLPAGHFNRLVRNTRNKAVVLLGLVLRVVDRIMRFAPGEPIRLHVDRLGGRAHYRDALMTAMSGYDLHVLEESATRSAYRLCRASRTCEIDFVTTGEGRHLPVALASVYSKYQRELYMRAFNRYWSGRIAGLRPTAGYYTDARRWLDETACELERWCVDRTLLVRER